MENDLSQTILTAVISSCVISTIISTVANYFLQKKQFKQELKKITKTTSRGNKQSTGITFA